MGYIFCKTAIPAAFPPTTRTGGNHDWMVIAPGETKTLFDVTGAGVIRRFYMAPMASDRMRYRKLVLRMYWDGEKEPSVEVPLGDFFGSGLGTLRYIHSLIVDINQGSAARTLTVWSTTFPMPFAKSARITLENDGKVPNFLLWYHIDFEQYPDGVLPPNAGIAPRPMAPCRAHPRAGGGSQEYDVRATMRRRTPPAKITM